MGGEIATGRLVAPYLGTSTPIWSALIATVMAALAFGSAVGGRLAIRRSAAPIYFIALAVAGGAMALTPTLVRPLMRDSIASAMNGHTAPLFVGTTVALILIFFPMALLGALAPILLQIGSSRVEDVGKISGRLGAFGTAGSLAGTLLCGLVWIPHWGTDSAFRIFGGVAIALGATGAILLRASNRAITPLLVLASVLCAVLFGLPTPPVHTTASVYEGETPYNYLRVVDQGNRRYLLLNEGIAQHSVIHLDGTPYFDGPWGHYIAAAGLPKKTPSRILIVGLGAGTTASYFATRLPSAHVTGIELDPGVVDVARTYFNLPASVDVRIGDARSVLERDHDTYDLVVVDAFQFPYTPFQLTTREFFTDVKRHIAPGGALAMNVGRKGRNLDLVYAVSGTLGTVFAHVNSTDSNSDTNTVVVATDHPLSESIGIANIGLPSAESAVLLRPEGFRPREIPERCRRILTDDHAPIEAITNQILLREAARILGRSSSPTECG